MSLDNLVFLQVPGQDPCWRCCGVNGQLCGNARWQKKRADGHIRCWDRGCHSLEWTPLGKGRQIRGSKPWQGVWWKEQVVCYCSIQSIGLYIITGGISSRLRARQTLLLPRGSDSKSPLCHSSHSMHCEKANRKEYNLSFRCVQPVLKGYGPVTTIFLMCWMWLINEQIATLFVLGEFTLFWREL